jgi:hypothetical protein
MSTGNVKKMRKGRSRDQPTVCSVGISPASHQCRRGPAASDVTIRAADRGGQEGHPHRNDAVRPDHGRDCWYR